MQKVSFKNNHHTVAGLLFTPDNFDAQQRYAAIVCIHPGSSCKEQTTSIYAKQLAQRGFVVLAFDASYQGESEGTPRFVEIPAARVEDVRCAIDYLVTLPYVDENRIGALGICAGGGYAANTAMIERRIKAVGTVVGANIGRVQREGCGDPIATLEAVAKQRTAEARGEAPMITGWIPNSVEEREQAGITDIDVVEAVEYYTTARGKQPGSPNKMKFTSMSDMLGFDAFHLADVLLTQPLQIIVGDKQGAFGSFRDGHTLYEKAASKEKDLYVLPGVSHYDLYDQPEPVAKAVEKLDAFYKKYLV